jgi:DNA-binding MarR family transcriptional regulator
MPDEALEAEQERIAEDASFVQQPTLATSRTRPSVSASSTATTRSAREIVLFKLVAGPTTPREIGDSEAVSTDSARRALNELHDRSLVEQLVPPEDADGPVFALTVSGNKVAYHIDREGS